MAKDWKVLDANGQVASSAILEAKVRHQKALSAYRGASSGRLNSDWETSVGDADSTLIPERMGLIYRIRERLRNDPVMRGCLKKCVDSVIGPKGFNTQAQLDAKRLGLSEQQARDIEREIDYEWNAWQKECDYSGNPARSFTFNSLLGLQFSTELTCGETLTIPRYVRRPWARFSFCIQLVAPDRIVSPGGFWASFSGINSDEDIRDGIKIGRRGDVQGAYIARQHPGSYNWFRDVWKVDFIPAYSGRTLKANFWHNYQAYRVEATRGEPAFAACLLGFKSLGDYVSDEMSRAHMASMFGLAITREEAFDADSEGLVTANKIGSADEVEHAQVNVYPGMINYLKPGETVSVVNPNIPGDQFDPFTDKIATWAGSSLGLSREQILNTYNGMSFSSAKASRDEAHRGFKKQQDDIVENYIEPVRERVIEEAWLRGRLNLPGFENPDVRRDYFSHVTYAAPWPYLEPVKEETGVELRLANGTSSLTRECSRAGHNLRDVIEERKREMQEFEAAGLPLPSYLREEPEPVLPGQGPDGAAAPAEKKKMSRAERVAMILQEKDE